jgi:Zinc finger C-x8-C-x5-C-x3-H type (and similar)
MQPFPQTSTLWIQNMKTFTPSPRRGALENFGDLRKGRGSVPRSNTSIDGGRNSLGIPLPPLYYKKREETEDDKATIDDFFHAYKTPEKKSGKPSFKVGKGSAFVPVERTQLCRLSGIPPLTPLVGKQLSYASHSPSTVSLVPTEDSTEGSWTPGTVSPGPSPAPSYLQAASSPITTPYQQSRTSPLPRTPRTPSPFARLIPSKSPKNYRRESPIPCSPANSSIGSSSTDEKMSRKQRLKTELCMHWTSGRECPFRDQCTYAHGEHELQITKLLDFQRAGLIEDAETYRTKPCLTWVATGSW